MSWMAKLYETYEQAIYSDLSDEDKPMPISHTLQNAHINIVIDGNGNFKRASVLEKTQIVLPATENSAGRSSGEAPHPLADKLQYVAKDYPEYGGIKKSYFEGYEKQLSEWSHSRFSNLKIKAIHAYINKGKVIENLINSGIVYIDEKSKLLTSWKGEEDQPKLFKVLPKKSGEIEQGDALVCWSVEIEGDPNADTWKDKVLQQSWIAFEMSKDAQKGFCFITGKESVLAINHPAKIRHTGDKAKLISSNDLTGFTYLGRFKEDEEASGISFEVTQKAHNALRWLVSRQGSQNRNGDQIFIAWAVSGKSVPSPLIDSFYLLDENDLIEVNDEDHEELKISIDHGKNFGQQFAEKFKLKMQGYLSELGDSENITLMGIDSATPGRLSIIYYREFNLEEFLNRLESWHLNFSWPQRYNQEVETPEGKKQKSKVIWTVSTPTPKAIAEAAYGKALKDSLKKAIFERLLPCIVEKAPIPKDLVEACVQSASNPNGYDSKEKWLWLKNISIACALYRGYCSERNPNINERREYDMSLDRNYAGRDYLYGRLLAIAEQIERKALDESGEKRPTNAERLMQRFSVHPFSTWAIIENSLSPYRLRLRSSKNVGLLNYFQQEIAQIITLVDHSILADDSALSGEYLLGYYSQKNYRKSKEKLDEQNVQATELLTNSEEI
jgi:CRISPR-associated protein Csd1